MADFELAIPTILNNEGGFVNDPNDKGGFTYRGITRKNFQNWNGWNIIDNIPDLKNGQIIQNADLEQLVKAFYKTNFWDKFKGDFIDNQTIAVFTFDWFVNAGSPAIKHLQECAGVNNDGIIGTGSITAINAADQSELLAKLKQARISFYNAIVANNPTQERFLNGWLNRVNSFDDVA